MAGAALLLLVLTALAGLGLDSEGRAGWTGGQAREGGSSAPGVAFDRSSPAALWGRLASLAQPMRPQGCGLGGSRLDDSPPLFALIPLAGAAAPVLPAPRINPRAASHWAASGQLSGRTPTGPPADLSLAL